MAAWTLGRVVGVIAGAIRLSLRPGVRRRKLSEREALLAEIARLEGELDQVYYLVAQGGGDLTELLSRVRDLKERLRKARARLKMIDRGAAMHLRFLRSLTSESRSPEEDLPDIGKIVSRRAEYLDDDEGGEYEFESLLDGEP